MNIPTDRDLKELISKKLQQLRAKSRQTLEESAYFLDLDYAQYYRILKGERLPQLGTLIKINQAYGLDMNWWFNKLAELPGKTAAQINRKEEDFELLANYHRLDKRAKDFVRKMLKNLS